MTAKGLLYTLLAISVISTAFMNTFSSVVNDKDALDIVVNSLITALFFLGLISLFLKAAAKWRRVGSVLFLIMGIGTLSFISSFYDDRGISYTDYPCQMFVHLAMGLSWVLSGILVWRGKVI